MAIQPTKEELLLRYLERRRDSGLAGGEPVRLYHCAAANKTIVELKLRTAPPVHRLYWRAPGEAGYHLVFDPGPERSMENMVGCSQPWLFAREVVWKPRGNDFSSGTVGILKVSLEDPSSVEPVDLTALLPPFTGLAELIRCNDAGTCLDAIATTRTPKEDDPSRSSTEYWLCSLDLENGRFVEHQKLLGRTF